MRYLTLLITTLFLASCGFILPSTESSKTVTNSKFIANEIIVGAAEEQIHISLAAKSISAGSIVKLDKNHDVFLVKFNSDVDVESLAQDMSSMESIAFAEPNFVLSLNSERPRDPLYLMQWAVQNIGQDSPYGAKGVAGADIELQKAWELNKGSTEIIVGVIDTGIDYNHPDLKANMWVNKAEKDGIAGIDDDGNGYADDVYGWDFITAERTSPYYGQLGDPDPYDDNGHGTHCAGVIGASPNNFTGIAGVNWSVKLMALKFLSKQGSGTSADAFRAVMYGIKNKAHVLSNSWGGGSPTKAMQYAIEQANKAGILFVAAAGNDASNNDQTPQYPAGYDVENVLSVAATDNKDQLADFSNYGSQSVDIAAPGVAIMSTVPVDSASSARDAYEAWSGTSMATPYVAGAAALLLAHDSSLIGNAKALKERLMNTVDVKPQLTAVTVSRGRLNVYRALTNDLNQDIVKRNSTFVAKTISSPRYHTEVFDKKWTIKHEGAKRIRLKFAYANADVPFYDVLAMYDKDFNLIYNFEDKHPGGLTTPWVEGDTVQLRFANALVLQRVPTEMEFDSPDDGFAAGADFCLGEENGRYTCTIMKDSDPFANFESEGFELLGYEYQD